MDEIDVNIVRELQFNARQTNQDIAEKINLSPSPCLRRTRLLEERGILQGYTAIVDHEKYGLPVCVFVSVRLATHNQETIDAFEDGIRRLDHVLACYLMSGNRDYLLKIVSEDLKSYERFVREELSRIPGIRDVDSSFAFGVVKQSYVLPEIKSPN